MAARGLRPHRTASLTVKLSAAERAAIDAAVLLDGRTLSECAREQLLGWALKHLRHN